MGLRELMERFTQGTPKEGVTTPDRFTFDESHPDAEEHRRLTTYLRQMQLVRRNTWELNPSDCEEGQALLALPREAQTRLLSATVERLAQFQQRHPQDYGTIGNSLGALASALLARHLPQTEETLVRTVDAVALSPTDRHNGILGYVPLGHVWRQAERFIEAHGLTPGVRAALERFARVLKQRLEDRDSRRIYEKIQALFDPAPKLTLMEEPWTAAAARDINALPEAEQAAWTAFLTHCRDSRPAKPSKKWLETARGLIEPLGEEPFRERALAWLQAVTQPASGLMPEVNAETLRGLFWACGLFADPELCRAVGSAAEACFKKIPEWGARCVLGGNGAVYTLSAVGTPEAIAQLARLRMRVKGRQPLATIEKALEEAAVRAGKSKEELEELCVPSYGLNPDGVLRETLGEYTAEVSFTLSGTAEWRWISADRKPQKSVPEKVKRECAEELAALKKTAAEVQKMLPAHRARVERLLRSERGWTYPDWRERYLDHPLIGLLARRLIWHFQDGERSALGIWHEGRLVDVDDRPLEGCGPETRVRLWHPIGFDPEVVLAWRAWLEGHRVVQPFKQAHREIYLLTDAELATRTYSNRFAGHIVRQHQFNQLCAAKGWVYRLQGGFDSGYDPKAALELPEWGLRAEYWVDIPDGPMAESGIFLYLSTDQVRFIDLDTREPRPLTEVPALAFTEAMRDVDMFVAVASIGADPEWRDRGEVRYAEYWHTYSFGELSASAVQRGEILERLIPRLKIAGRCTLEGKFLKVRGDLRTYKIHLGSGNILMEPNDQYLCIVPDRGGTKTDGVFLPFEGDSTLAVILSKAFLLAEDTKIKDASILSQIRHR